MVSEWIGLLAAFVAALSFGSYSVPMKGEAATKCDVDALVFQSYKSFMVFAMSWLVLLSDTKPSFTWWGLVSASLWVPAGTCGIYAVRRAGLAVSVGIWASVIVFISFLWGICIFGEQISSISGTIGAASLLCVGLWGIAYFSSPSHQKGRSKAILQHHVEEMGPFVQKDIEADPLTDGSTANYGATADEAAVELEPLTDDGYVKLDLQHFPHSGKPPWSEKEVDLIIIHDTQYHLGLAMAALNGFLAASIMVPLHYAGHAKGLKFAISFGTGAMIVTALMWLVRLANNAVKMGSIRQAYNTLPSFHIRVMWAPGCLAGALYSVGNFSSILAISTLGDFLGYSLGQGECVLDGAFI